MNTLGIIGRIIFGGYFIMMGLNHFMKLGMMTGYAASKKVPAPKLAVIAGGILLLLGGTGIVLNSYIKESAVLLIVFLAPVSFMMHAFWSESDPQAKMADMNNFMKNMALLGAVLMMFANSIWQL